MDAQQKKEIKQKYKESTAPMGVYQITNLNNGKRFIGSSKNVNGRINRTKFELDLGSYPDKELQNDYKESEKGQFTFEVIDVLEPREEPGWDYDAELQLLEEMWLERLMPFGDHGYNILKDAKEK